MGKDEALLISQLMAGLLAALILAVYGLADDAGGSCGHGARDAIGWLVGQMLCSR